MAADLQHTLIHDELELVNENLSIFFDHNKQAKEREQDELDG